MTPVNTTIHTRTAVPLGAPGLQRPRRIWIVVAIAAVSALAGCGASVVIPKPGVLQPPPLPALEASVVEIPITMNLTPMLAELEKAVPKGQRADQWTVVSNNAVGDVGITYNLRRWPLQLVVGDNTVRATSRVQYGFSFAQRVPKPIIGGSFWQELGSCGVDEPPREAVVGLQSSLRVTNDWALQSTSSVLPTQFPNRCEITFLKFDITGKVNDAFAAGLAQGARIADARINEVARFKPIGEQAWRALAEPVKLDSAVWLMMDPATAWAGPITSGGAGMVKATVGFTAVPRVVFGAMPRPPARALPPLGSRAVAGDGFHATVEGSIAYNDAARLLKNALADQTFTMAGHDVRVTDVAIYCGGDRAVVQLALAGDINGTIYLLGTPAYDPKANTVYVRDLDYSLETGNVLANTADWLLHGSFRGSIAEQARWPLGEGVAQARAQIERALNRQITPGVTARGTVRAVRPIGVFMTPERFVARASVDGMLRLEVK